MKFPGNINNSLTERDISSPAAARTISVFVLSDDDGRRRRREVDQKEHALVHDAGDGNQVGVMQYVYSALSLRFTAAHMTCMVRMYVLARVMLRYASHLLLSWRTLLQYAVLLPLAHENPIFALGSGPISLSLSMPDVTIASFRLD